MAFFGGSNSSANSANSASAASDLSSTELKNALMQQVQAEAAMTNARALVGKINENCFERCVPTPGSSLSSSETNCLSACMEKYIAVWNNTSRTYISRVQAEQKKAGSL